MDRVEAFKNNRLVAKISPIQPYNKIKFYSINALLKPDFNNKKYDSFHWINEELHEEDSVSSEYLEQKMINIDILQFAPFFKCFFRIIFISKISKHGFFNHTDLFVLLKKLYYNIKIIHQSGY